MLGLVPFVTASAHTLIIDSMYTDCYLWVCCSVVLGYLKCDTVKSVLWCCYYIYLALCFLLSFKMPYMDVAVGLQVL